MDSISMLSSVITSSHYQIADLVLLPAGNNLTLVYSKNSRVARLLDRETVHLLIQCREFKTLDAHIQSYCDGRQLSATTIRAMQRELQRLVQSGYLISQGDVQTAFQRLDEHIPSTSIASIVFPTCNRIEMLQRCMVSYFEYCKRFGRGVEFVVADDSEAVETRNAYRKMLGILKSHHNVNITYAGFEEKMAFVRKLSEIGNIPVDVVSFACLGDKKYGLTTIGANRNVLLLHTIGDVIFSSDDDILCQIAPSPSMKEGIALLSRGNPLEVWFFQNRESLLHATHFVEQDILRRHEQLLGKGPNSWSITGDRDEQILFDRAEPDFLRRLTTQSGKIVLTVNGVFGDCSWDNADYHLFQRGETFRRLTYSEHAYRSARSSREMVQVVNQVTILEKANHLFAMCMGLDNRELLPPFTPIGRAEDVAFTIILSKCFKSAYVSHLPWTLLHAPHPPRSFLTNPIFSVGFNSWIPSCINLFDPGFVSTPAERLQKLGHYLEEIGHLPKPAFEEFIRFHLWNTMSVLISGLEEQVAMHENPPSFWLQDVKAFIVQARQSSLLAIDQLYVLRGGQEEMQRLLVRFGQVLVWWPLMSEMASRLRLEGYRLAQSI